MARNVLWTKRNASLDDGPDVASAFAPVKPLGEGAFGVVLLVRKVLGHGRGSLHAMKIMDKASVDARVLAHSRSCPGCDAIVFASTCLGRPSPGLRNSRRLPCAEHGSVNVSADLRRMAPRERPAKWPKTTSF